MGLLLGVLALLGASGIVLTLVDSRVHLHAHAVRLRHDEERHVHALVLSSSADAQHPASSTRRELVGADSGAAAQSRDALLQQTARRLRDQAALHLPAAPADWPSTLAAVRARTARHSSSSSSSSSSAAAAADVNGPFLLGPDLSPRCVLANICDFEPDAGSCGGAGLACVRDAAARQRYVREAMRESWDAYE